MSYTVRLVKNGRTHGKMGPYTTKKQALADAQRMADDAAAGVKVYVEPGKTPRPGKRKNNPDTIMSLQEIKDQLHMQLDSFTDAEIRGGITIVVRGAFPLMGGGHEHFGFDTDGMTPEEAVARIDQAKRKWDLFHPDVRNNPGATVSRQGNIVRWRRGQHSVGFQSVANAKEAVKRFKAGGRARDWREIRDRMEAIREAIEGPRPKRNTRTNPCTALATRNPRRSENSKALWSRNKWRIEWYDPAAKWRGFAVVGENHADHPTIYSLNEVGYDRPEVIPKYVKAAVEKLAAEHADVVIRDVVIRENPGRNPTDGPWRLMMDLGEYRRVAGPYRGQAEAHRAKVAHHHQSWGDRAPEQHTRIRKYEDGWYVYSYDPVVAGPGAHEFRNPAGSGQFFVVVDVSAPGGGKWVGLRGRKIYPHRDLADADREADILRGRVSSAVRKRHPHDAGIQVIDALWYGPAREVLRKQGITANPSRKNTGPSTRVWTLSVMPKFPGGSLELAALNTTTRAEVVGTANNFMNPSWRKRHGIPKYVEEKARELARERGETLFEPRRNPRERQRENPARRIGEDPAGRAPAVEEAMAKAEWALKDAEEAGRNAFALGDMAGVKKYARQIEKAQRDLSKLRTAQEMTGQRATWGSWRRGLREETDFRRRVGREAGEIIAGQRRGGRYTNPRRNAGRKRNAGGPIPRSNGYGPDPRGRGWTKRGNHWLWDNPTAGVTFMVLEKQGPGIPIYKLQALTDHGMYRHTKPAQWKTPQPAYAAAAEWFPALSGETVYSDLTQHWLRSNPSRHEVLTTTVPLDGRPLTSTERGRLRKLGFSVSEGAMVEQAGEKWYGHVYYPVRGGGWTSADIAVTTVP